MPKITVNDKILEIEEGYTIIQACKMNGIEIPHFCYHDKLAIAGNCRMCLVEVEKSPKLVASCAMPIQDGMVIHTDSPKVEKARQGVMEFLLINHPLDCPICDQGGECDLQDQAFKYGSGKSRFEHNKRAVPNKDFGPLVKTEMNRCIHCMRCVRFATDIAGIEEIGSVGRGEHMEITNYVKASLKSELSGNIIDICPVGALTSKQYAFKYRNWELTSTPSVDVMDALGSNIIVDSRSKEVMRILPYPNDDINEIWISDKTRFALDGLKNQRLDRPYVKKAGKLMPATWEEAISTIVKQINLLDPSKIGAIVGTYVDLESMFLLKTLIENLGSKNYDYNQFGYNLDTSLRSNYIFNSTISGIENADLCLLIGANPRFVAPVLNARIGKMARKNKMLVGRIGDKIDQNYKIIELGNDPLVLEEILDGSHLFSKEFKKAKNPIIIIGDGVYTRSDSLAICKKAEEIVKKYNGVVNFLHNHASTVGALDIGFTNPNNIHKMIANLEFVYLFGADDIDIPESDDVFVIYQGHHGDKGAHRADVVLPGAAYTEKDGIYINTEGRAQYGYKAVDPVGDAKDDREIISMIISNAGFNAPKDLAEIRNEIAEIVPAVRNMGSIIPTSEVNFQNSKGKIQKSNIVNMKFNFYLSDPISRASVTMAKCFEAANSN